ncbi:hypothetical protein JCM10207_004444 [Rhodosporidiobolus poonsookiae]
MHLLFATALLAAAPPVHAALNATLSWPTPRSNGGACEARPANYTSINDPRELLPLDGTAALGLVVGEEDVQYSVYVNWGKNPTAFGPVDSVDLPNGTTLQGVWDALATDVKLDKEGSLCQLVDTSVILNATYEHSLHQTQLRSNETLTTDGTLAIFFTKGDETKSVCADVSFQRGATSQCPVGTTSAASTYRRLGSVAGIVAGAAVLAAGGAAAWW